MNAPVTHEERCIAGLRIVQQQLQVGVTDPGALSRKQLIREIERLHAAFAGSESAITAALEQRPVLRAVTNEESA